MKKIIYSSPLKFAAVIICALAMALSSYLITANFLKEDNFYLFEDSYEDSHSAGNLVINEFYNLSNYLENTLDKSGKLHPEKIRYMPSSDEWEYYIVSSGETFTNIQNGQSYENFQNSPLSRGVRVKKDERGIAERQGFRSGQSYDGYWFITDNNGNAIDYELCVRMGEKYKEENRIAWETMKTQADGVVKTVLLLFALSALCVIYLLCVTGRKYNSDAVHTMLVDKMFVEITAALFLGILIGGGALSICSAVYLIWEEEIAVGNLLTAVAIFAVVSLSLTLLLSLVRNMKNGTFVKRSLIVRFCRFVWRFFVKICRFAWKAFKRICKGIRNGLSEAKKTLLTVSAKNFSGRFVGILLVAFAAGVCILTVLTLESPVCIIILALFVIGAVIFTAKRLIGFEKIKEGIEKIRNGELTHKIEDCPDGVIGEMAKNINSIGEGLGKSLEREVKAERMKSELITNVSHDLKTPLTSIINYADLLSKETLTPPEANDYVKIIKQKGERLKQLTNDLFDISKVQSGNEEFNMEDIDLCLLANQTMGELNEAIKKSELVFKLTSTDKEVYVKADGRKMSRVFENLIVNCVKYAMKNTRVYIDIRDNGNDVSVEIKNIAGYEMDFDESEIAERFVRGDASRNTEGSGLGLAIVKSYVEGCGGTLEIKKDGDLFKVILNFPK